MTAAKPFPEDFPPAHQDLSDPNLTAEETRLVELFRHALVRPFPERDASRVMLMKALACTTVQEIAFLAELKRERQISQPLWLVPMKAEVHQALFAYVDSFLAHDPGEYGVSLERLAKALATLLSVPVPSGDFLGFSEVATLLDVSFAELQRWIDAGRIPRGVFSVDPSGLGPDVPACQLADLSHLSPALIESWRTIDAMDSGEAQQRALDAAEGQRVLLRGIADRLNALCEERGFQLLDRNGRAVRTDAARWDTLAEPELCLTRMVPVRATVVTSGRKPELAFCVTVRLSERLRRPASIVELPEFVTRMSALDAEAVCRRLGKALTQRLHETFSRFGSAFPAESPEQFGIELQRELSRVLVPDDILESQRFFTFTSAPVARLTTARWRADHRQ